MVADHAEPRHLKIRISDRFIQKPRDAACTSSICLCFAYVQKNTNMGAQESKRWSELLPETPQVVDKRLTRLQIPDPRSPFLEGPRTPIQLESYEESPHNRELNIEDPRSPSLLIERTPITVAAEKNIRESKSVIEDYEKEKDQESGDHDEVQSGSEEINAVVSQEPPSPDIAQINKLLSEISVSPISPGAPLSKKDTARLLKKTTSPSDFKRKRRLSGRRKSVPQKLFASDKVAPIPRSPLAQRNSADLTEAVKKGNKLSFRAQKTKRPSLQEGLYYGKENAQAPLVI